MPDVFLSYSREDATIARRFAEGFGREGLTVWWDATLKSGEAYDEVTEKALNDAKAVVVLWSTHSVASRWVRAEATEADRNKTLVPVMIEPCKRPIMFELTHTADLSGWNGDSREPAWMTFVADVKRFTSGNATSAPSVSPAPVAPKPSARRTALPIFLTVAAGLAVAALVAWWAMGKVPSAARAPAAVMATTSANASASVAVVPFANLTGETGKDYFSDGMAEELINALAKVPGLKVASRTSSFAYKGRNSDIRQIARDLGVATILEGSVRSAGDRVRVNAQLTSAESGYQLWSESYDRRFDDLFKLQDDLAREIVTAFRKTVGNEVAEFQSAGPPTQDLEAYQLYLKGVAAINRNSDASLREAIGLLEQAVARDPRFARAFQAMGRARALQTNSSLDEVERDVRRAYELDPSLSSANLLAQVLSRRYRFAESEQQMQPLGNSSDASDHTAHALNTLWPTGRLREATRELLEATRLAPTNAANANTVARAYSTAGNDERAMRYLQESIVLGVDANGRRTLQTQAEVAQRAGRFSEAAALFKRTLPDRLLPLGANEAVTLVYAAFEDPAKTAAAVQGLKRLVPRVEEREWVIKVFAMQSFSRLGDVDAAYDVGRQLQKQFEKEAPYNPWAWLWVPELRAFRNDARFQGFVAQLNMIPYWEKYGPPDDCTLANGVLSCK